VFVVSSTVVGLHRHGQRMNGYFRFYELARASEMTGVPLYFFSPRDVHLRKRQVLGTYYNHARMRWERKRFPLPDILYDRCASTSPRAKTIRRRFTQWGIIPLNAQHHFDKWDVYMKLLNDAQIWPYLPRTILYRRPEDLLAFLLRYQQVYVKAVDKSRSRKVLRLAVLPDGGYEYSFFHKAVVVGTRARFHDVYKIIRALFKSERKVIIQKAIPLIRLSDHTVDFRAEVQRNGQGQLDIVGICARIGQARSPITIHADALPFEQFWQLKGLTPLQIRRLRADVQQFLLTIYRAIESNYGPFGELGIDFGIDEDENIWFIECNAKSAKVSLYKAYDEDTVRRAFINPLEYARYLYHNRQAAVP